MDTVIFELFFTYDDKIMEDQNQMSRIEIIKGIAKKWDCLSGSQRYEALKENNISALGKVRIENISRRFIRLKSMLNHKTQEQPIQ